MEPFKPETENLYRGIPGGVTLKRDEEGDGDGDRQLKIIAGRRKRQRRAFRVIGAEAPGLDRRPARQIGGLVGRYALSGPCPLHSPKPDAADSTSFACDDEEWACATCQTGGDVFKLVALRHGLDEDSARRAAPFLRQLTGADAVARRGREVLALEPPLDRPQHDCLPLASSKYARYARYAPTGKRRGRDMQTGPAVP